MVKHIFLTCGVLLSATAQTAFAKELEGMLVTQNNYVRIRSCDLKNNYTLLPGSGNGYEAAAEIISVRKNTPENTPIYVGLRGNLENNSTVIAASPGDKLSVRDCLYSLLLHSANDCANALAEHVAGSKEAFVAMMNKK